MRDDLFDLQPYLVQSIENFQRHRRRLPAVTSVSVPTLLGLS